MTGLQYINFICDIYEVPSKMRKQNFEKLALAFQMGPHLNNLISSYSHGMKQKLALIAAFSHTPKLLILDEPLHGLDTYNRRRVKKIIEAFCHRRDKTMIMVTHYENELPQTITNRLFLKRNR